MKCEHEYTRTGYGHDLICKKCNKIFIQSVLPMPSIKPSLKREVNVTVKTDINKDVSRLIADEINRNLLRDIAARMLGD